MEDRLKALSLEVKDTASIEYTKGDIEYYKKIDLDPQANLSQSLGVVEPEYTIYGSLKGEYPLKPLEVYKNLELIPSTLVVRSFI